jgi:hypothetical protein
MNIGVLIARVRQLWQGIALFYLGFAMDGMNDHLKIEFEDKMIWPARNSSAQCKISTGFT